MKYESVYITKVTFQVRWIQQIVMQNNYIISIFGGDILLTQKIHKNNTTQYQVCAQNTESSLEVDGGTYHWDECSNVLINLELPLAVFHFT